MPRPFPPCLVAAALLAGSVGRADAGPRSIDFEREVRPILASRCLSCHGPEKRRGGLLLSERAAALAPTDAGKPAILPGDSARSELLARVRSAEKGRRMPPTGPALTAGEIDTLRRWIDGGAAWPDAGEAAHWAYVAPRRPVVPRVRQAGWVRNPVDGFVLARLEREGLAPSPEADPQVLLRRVYLDLVGLPPTPEEADAFLADRSPDAYEKAVDRLLASPHFGEKWARHWLDLARYADSNGYQRDGFREVWPYRDWVVRAFNSSMPFDRFTIEQVAGDLLPGATLDQKIATGFHRCTTVNVEAGVDREEGRVEAIFDRVSTLATVWLGATMVCAQCHNHKYDPFTQVDYYRLFAYFNNTPIETEETNGTARQLAGPWITLPLPPDQEQQHRQLTARRDSLARRLEAEKKSVLARQASWEEEARQDQKALARLPANVRKILATPAARRNAKQKAALEKACLEQHPATMAVQKDLARLEGQLERLKPTTSLVLVEMEKPRATHVFRRGSFLEPGVRVEPGTPAVLPPLPEDAPANRLALARWLVDPANPLTARVTVNRFWAEVFGEGIVATLEDLGTQSSPPSHPELLDWLSVEFREQGWSVKHLLRLLVTSAAYRQDARISPELLRRDPDNRLLARGPRFRLSAEAVRDNALAVSGLLGRKMGGPPVRPPQPAGIWNVTGNVDNTYRTSEGLDRYRRGLYTVWRRSSPYPSFVAFDAPDRGACVVRRPRTNTPLQALTLLNDPVYVEAAHALASRVLAEGDGLSPPEQLTRAFRLCLTRSPRPEELAILERVHQAETERLRADPAAARALLQGREAPAGVDPVRLAVWYHLATLLLNLDETITKG